MIVAQSPLRISLGGGGTDLPSYYRKHEGFLIAGAIDKYVYVTVSKSVNNKIILTYPERLKGKSRKEEVASLSEIEHPIIREAILASLLKDLYLTIEVTADTPFGTGLGSSGSFITALLKALAYYNEDVICRKSLAELACHIEIDRLREPVGKQDQYSAVYGGLTCFTFHKNDQVTLEPLQFSRETLVDLEVNLLLFCTGYSRRAGALLKDQDQRTLASDARMIDNLHKVKELGYNIKKALELGNTKQVGEFFHEHWEYKKWRSPEMSNSDIDRWYEIGLTNGAIGGKLVGAGGGGFLLFYANNPTELRHAMKKEGLKELPFRFDFEGTKIIE